MLWRGVNVCSCSAFIVQEDLPDVESAIFQSVIQESLHDVGGEKEILITQSQVMTSAGVCISSTKSLSSEFM